MLTAAGAETEPSGQAAAINTEGVLHCGLLMVLTNEPGTFLEEVEHIHDGCLSQTAGKRFGLFDEFLGILLFQLSEVVELPADAR
jgi:hypothetical protein